MMIIDRLDPKSWQKLSENAHLICFNKHKPADWDRIDFALLAKTPENELAGYITCREHDAHTVYWQFGGTFPGARSTSLSFRAYQEGVAWCKSRYKRISTLIENDNVVMLKMAMAVGFRAVGIRFFNQTVLLEMLLEFP
jgi:RimJ/RimL family protein N-acetyltransferase